MDLDQPLINNMEKDRADKFDELIRAALEKNELAIMPLYEQTKIKRVPFIRPRKEKK